MNEVHRLLKAFALGIEPDAKVEIVDWAKTSVLAAGSQQSTFTDLNQSPWLIEPLKTAIGQGPDVSKMIISGHTGSGKTTFLTALACYIVEFMPTPSLFCIMTESDARSLMEERVLPAFKTNKKIRSLLPKDKTKLRRDTILFDSMPFHLVALNHTNVQGRSAGMVVVDEYWQAKGSLLEHATRRTHDRYKSKVIFTGQASDIGTPAHQEYLNCLVLEYNYKCPSCGEYHEYDFFKNIKFEVEKSEDGDYNYDTLNVWFECPCGARYEDDVQSRRLLSQYGAYQPSSTQLHNYIPKHIAYNYNVLCMWRVDWKQIVTQYLVAKTFQRKGNYSKLGDFYKQRLAKFWDGSFSTEQKVHLSDYLIEEATPWPGSKVFCGVDVQGDRIYFVIRCYIKTGESRLLDYGILQNLIDIEEIRKKWSIQPANVLVDYHYNKDVVIQTVANYGYTGMDGVDKEDFVHNIKGRSYKKIHSPMKELKATSGKSAYVFHFASSNVSEILSILKSGNGVPFHIPSDVDEYATKDYTLQMNSQVKRFKDGKATWTGRYDGVKDHLWDCEKHCLVAAIIANHFPCIVPQEVNDK